MLSFSRRAQCSISTSSSACSSHDVLDSGRYTLSLQVPAQVVIPENAERRRRYLTALAIDYLCRWRTSMPSQEPFDNEDAESTAFYAAIADLETMQRAHLFNVYKPAAGNSVVAATTPDGIESYDLCAPVTACTSTLLHDWSHDTVQKQYFAIKDRPHVLVHFSHPCNYGRHLLPLNETPAATAEKATTVIDADESNKKRQRQSPLHDAMLNELVGAVRQRSNPSTVAEQVEQQRQQRIEKEQQQKERHEQQTASCAGETAAVCATIIDRVRKDEQRRLGSSTSSSSEKEDDDDTFDDDDAEAKADDASATWDDEEENGSDNDTSSDTFSSSSDDDATKNREKPSWADVVRAVHQSPIVPPTTTADVQKETPPDTAGQDEKTKEEPLPPVEKEPVLPQVAEAQTVAETALPEQIEEKQDQQPKRPRAMRQTAVEMMVPICEPEDTLQLFDQLECRYILLWARERDASSSNQRRRLHLLRREDVVERSYFGIYSTKRSRYHLIATIEALV